jgi:TonB family protein
MRVLGIVVLTICALLAVRERALAVVEYCPTQIVERHDFGDADPGLYSLGFSGGSERVVSGDVVVQTNSGWFTFPFSDVHVAPDKASYKNSYVAFWRTHYLSQPLYVRFPSSVTSIVRSWVSDAQSTGDTVMGWDARGNVGCLPLAGAGVVNPHILSDNNFAERETPPFADFTRVPGPQDKIVTANLTSAPGGLDCSNPFVNAIVRHPIAPRWPFGYRIDQELEVLVEVDISATGALDDATIYQPSGSKAFDNAALDAARNSTYTAGTALCQPAPGTYIFRAIFRPD